MVDLIIRFDGLSKCQELHNLTLKELGTVLAEFGEKYHLVFETVREVEAGIGCTIIIGAIEKG